MGMKSGANQVTILVNSCDLYEDAWEPFFRLFHIQWPDCPYDIVLNTEKKVYQCSFMQVKTICTGENISWSKRVKKALKEIDSEFICFFLEDFFLTEKVNGEIFQAAFDYMKMHRRVGVIHFMPAFSVWKLKGDFGKYFTYVCRASQLRTQALTALWRKEYLYKLLRDRENPWEYERFSPLRAARMFQQVLCLKPDMPKPFHYSISLKNGLGISERTWLPKNKELFESYGIEVNFDNLGWYSYKTKSSSRKKRTKKELRKLVFTHPGEVLNIIMVKFKQKMKWCLENIRGAI